MGRSRSPDRANPSDLKELASVLDRDRIASLATLHGIPSDARCMTPRADERIYPCPTPTSITVYEDQFRAGLRVPFHSVFCDICRIFLVTPSQLTPNSIRLISGFLVLCHRHGIVPRASLFGNFFTLKKDFHGSWWWVFGPHPDLRIFMGLPSAIHGWKTRFFYIHRPGGWDFDTVPRRPCLDMNEEGKLILVGDQIDFDKLVATGVGDRATPIAALLTEDCLHLAGVSPISHPGESVPRKPDLALARQLARKKKRSAQDGEGESRLKRRTESGLSGRSTQPDITLPPPESPPAAGEVAGSQGSPQAGAAPPRAAEAQPVARSSGQPSGGPSRATGPRDVGPPLPRERTPTAPSNIPAGGAAPSGRQEGDGPRNRRAGKEPAPEGTSGGGDLPPEELEFLFTSDEPRVTDLGPFQHQRAFDDPALAGTLLRAITLPEDWKETCGRPVESVGQTILSDLIRVIHGALRLSEGFDSAVGLGREALQEYDAAHGWAVHWKGQARDWEKRYKMEKKVSEDTGSLLTQWREKAKSLLQSAETSKKALTAKEAELDLLKGELRTKDTAASGLQQMVDELLQDRSRVVAGKDEEIRSLRLEVSREKARADEASRCADDAEAKLEWTTSELERAVAEVEPGKKQAVASYKASLEHQMDLAETGAASYDAGFLDGLKEVKK